MEAILAVLCILITEAALIASHATYANPWWRKPLWFSDRWHILSFLCHYPIVCFVLWVAVPRILAVPVAIASWLIWQGVKILAGKEWDPIVVQFWKWMK